MDAWNSMVHRLVNIPNIKGIKKKKQKINKLSETEWIRKNR